MENQKVNEKREGDCNDLPAIPEEPLKQEKPELSIDLISRIEKQYALLNEINQMIIEDHRTEKAAIKKSFDHLYTEMKEKKEFNGIIDRSLKPLLVDIILFFDNLKNTKINIESNNLTLEQAGKEIELSLNVLLELLYRQDVELIEVDKKNIIDKKLQKVLKVLPTDNEEENDVCEIIRSGFLWRNSVLRPENIVIKKYSENKEL